MKSVKWYFAVGTAAVSLLFASCSSDEPADDNQTPNGQENTDTTEPSKPSKPKPSVDLDNIELSGTSWEIVSLSIEGSMGDSDWRTFVAEDWEPGNDLVFFESGDTGIYRADGEQSTFYEPWFWTKNSKYLVIGEEGSYPMEGAVTFSKEDGFVYLNWVANLGGGALPEFDLTLKRAVSDFAD